jgi:ABC-type phosphate transport system auxiliary subunit
MGDSEREYLEKISKTKFNSSKKVTEVLDVFGKSQKLKAESLKKTEEMMTVAASDLEKLERDKTNNKDLSGDSQKKINEEIATARSQIRQKYDELKTRIMDHAQ